MLGTMRSPKGARWSCVLTDSCRETQAPAAVVGPGGAMLLILAGRDA